MEGSDDDELETRDILGLCYLGCNRDRLCGGM